MAEQTPTTDVQLPYRGSYFAWRAATLFGIAIVGVSTLNICQEHQIIDSMTEGFLRLLINAALCGGLLIMTWKSDLSPLLSSLIVFATLASICDTFLSFTEDVPQWSEIPLIGANSQIRPVIESIANASWMIGGFMLIFASIAAIQKTHRQLNHRNERLETTVSSLKNTQQRLVQRERLSALGEMASGVAHDLNNNLAPIVAYSELLLKSGDLKGEHRTWLECIRDGGLDMASTVNGLKRFYQNSDSIQQATDLRPLIEQVVEMTKPRWLTEPEQKGNHINLNLELADKTVITCDPHEMRTVLTNLIFNAVDAMPEGGTLTLRLTQHDSEVVIEINDTGIGMTAEQINKCFEPFISWKERGSGLGLSICHGIIERQRGSISVDSEEGRGTTFTIIFSQTAPSDDTTTSTPEGHTSYKEVLLVDDDDVVRDSMKAMLEVLGAKVTSSSSGVDALKHFDSQQFDVVITDLGMKGMDGVELIEKIRATKPNQLIAVVSGWPEESVLRRFSPQHPPHWFLQKPVKVNDLEQILRRPSHFPHLPHTV